MAYVDGDGPSARNNNDCCRPRRSVRRPALLSFSLRPPRSSPAFFHGLEQRQHLNWIWMRGNWAKCRSRSIFTPLLHVQRQPVQKYFVPELAVLWLQHPVSLIWKDQEFGRHALPLQRVEKLQRLRVRHAKISFSRDHQRRRLVFSK